MSEAEPRVSFIDHTVPGPPPDPFATAPFSEVSIELGCHFYPDEWAEIAERGEIPPQHMEDAADVYRSRVRWYGADAVSTCLFLDGYNGKLDRVIEPAYAVELLAKSAEAAKVPLHYIGSEGACAGELASKVLTWLIAPPPTHTNGAQEPTAEKGWVSNGLLPTGELREYDNNVPHSISTAVEIFADTPPRKKQPGERIWACPYLASVWQLARLGLLPPEHMQASQEAINADTTWDDLPLTIQLDPSAPPFIARRTRTILPKRYAAVVNAEALILNSLTVPTAYRKRHPQLPTRLADLAGYVLDEE